MINGYINGQTLRMEQDTVVTETIDWLMARFFFDESWDGCVVWAHFTKGAELYDVLLDADREIKPERHLNLQTGDWKIYLHGNRYAGDAVVQRVTTEEKTIRVENTGVRNGYPLPEIEAGVAEQLSAMIGDPGDLETEAKTSIVAAVNEIAEGVNNLDVDAEKVGRTVTVTVTKKDGTEKVVTVSDGDPAPEELVVPAVDAWLTEHPDATIDEGIITAATEGWLDDHPEATTTVQDGSISEQKLTEAVAGKVNAVPDVQTDLTELYSMNDEVSAYNDVQYYNNCYVASSAISPSSGSSVRTFVFEIEKGFRYVIKVKDNDRFRIGLANELFSGTSIPSKLLLSDDTQSEYTLLNTEFYSYCYVYVSNTSRNCAVTITKKRVYETYETPSYTYTYFVRTATYNGHLQSAEGTTARTFCFKLKPYTDYVVKVNHAGTIDRGRASLTDYLFGEPQGRAQFIGEYTKSFSFNSGDFLYLHYFASNNNTEPPVCVYESQESTYRNRDVVLVTDFGAKGDGYTDDTEALEEAFRCGYAFRKPVVFPSGEYVIRRSLTLRSGMEIYGVGRPTIRKKKSSTTRLAAQLSSGSSTMQVESADGFEVGDQITVSSIASTYPAARHCTVGYITAIEGNAITFTSAYDAIKPGAVKKHAAGCYVTNSCAIMRSWGMFYECRDVYIHDLILDGNRVNGEFGDWMNGTIHIDATTGTQEGIPYTYSAGNLTVRDCTIMNSPFDGISDQSEGGATIENCKISNCYMHGVHFGTTYAKASVVNNDIRGTENGAAVFWCQNVEDIIVQGNRITNCKKGCSDYEYGTAGQNSIISGNVFDGIVSTVFDFSIDTDNFEGKIIIDGNIIKNCKSVVAKLPKKANVIFTSNTISNFVTTPGYLFNISDSSDMVFGFNIALGVSTIFSGTCQRLKDIGNSWN